MGEPEYLYLPNSPFHTNFTEAVEDSTTKLDTKYEVYVGIYSLAKTFSIDESAKKIPFLRFLSILENGTYTFPHFSCTLATFDSEYVTYLMKLFEQNVTGETVLEEPPNPSPFQPEHVLINDVANTAIVLFSFDAMVEKEMFSNHAILSLDDSTPVLNMKWAIVDEIVFEKKLLTLPFDPKVTEFFSIHESLWNIEYDKVYIDFPFSVYPVEEKDGKLVNTTGEVAAIDSYSQHEDYGDRYCFTYLPISASSSSIFGGNSVELIRYSVYTYQTKYLVEQTGGAKEEKEKQSRDSLDEIDTPNSKKDNVDSEVSLDDSLKPAETEKSRDSLDEIDTPNSKKENPDKLIEENADSEVSLDDSRDSLNKKSEEEEEEEEEKIKEESGVSLNKSLKQDEMEESRDSLNQTPEDSLLEEEKKPSADTSEEKTDESVSLKQEKRDTSILESEDSLDNNSLKQEKRDTSILESEDSLDNNSLKQEKRDTSILESEDSLDKTPGLKDTPNSVEQDSLDKEKEQREKLEEEDTTLIPTPESNVLAMEESEQSLNLLSIPTIYFYEPIDGNQVVMWGMLNPNLICKL